MTRSMISIGVAVLLSIVAADCFAGVILSAGASGYYSYSWAPLNGTSPQWDSDAYRSNLSYQKQYYSPNQTYYSFVHVTSGSAGTIEWHYRTDNGAMFSDDVEVTYQVNLYNAGAWGANGYWSTDGITYREFFYVGRGPRHIPLTTTALKDSDYAGGQDLYVKFYLSRAGGFDGPDTVQLFRQGSLTPSTTVPSFVVSGTVVPEPAGLAMIAVMLATTTRPNRRER